MAENCRLTSSIKGVNVVNRFESEGTHKLTYSAALKNLASSLVVGTETSYSWFHKYLRVIIKHARWKKP